MHQSGKTDLNPGSAKSANNSSLAVMGLSALGIVFGDIGTSPLYTFKTILNMTGGTPVASVVHRTDGKGVRRWMEEFYAAMARNSMRAADLYRLPNDDVVDIGRQIAI